MSSKTAADMLWHKRGHSSNGIYRFTASLTLSHSHRHTPTPSAALLLSNALRRLLFSVTPLAAPLRGDAAAAFSPRWHRCCSSSREIGREGLLSLQH
ncbi:uncharacterized protein [Arachis hypogaea]|uniref:uncharacterized protein isoform X2 n=1 Tax=Arachis hypogaea TaxID=3818 RepID=UPI003B217741